MAQKQGKWISFEGGHSCLLDEIVLIYASDNNTRVMLKSGHDFYVPEAYDNIMSVILGEQ